MLIDGGTGDDDGEQDGFIEDPLGLGTAPPGSVSTQNVSSSDSGGGGGGGCFVNHSKPNFQVLIIRIARKIIVGEAKTR